MKTAQDIMQKDFVVLDIREKTRKVVELLSRNDLTCIIVTNKQDNNRVAGLITQRDLIKKILLKKKSQNSVKIKELMTADVITVHAEDPLSKVQGLMKKHLFKHVPVTKNGSIIGLVSQTHLAEEMKKLEENYNQVLWYQNAQTIIIICFLIFLIGYLFYRLM